MTGKSGNKSKEVPNSSQKLIFDQNDSSITVGFRLEANDFHGNWYAAKIKDVDWNNREVFIHFENWNSKFDEWIKMDSSRLRPAQTPPKSRPIKPKTYKKGDKVVAMWNAVKKFPGTIQKVYPDSYYDVRFFDGFEKRLHTSKIWRISVTEYAAMIHESSEIGSKQDRRDRKRKINVAELFKKPIKRKRTSETSTKPSTSEKKEPLTSPPATPPTPTATSSAAPAPTSAPTPTPSATPTPKLGPVKPPLGNVQAVIDVLGKDGHVETWSKVLQTRKDGQTAGKVEIVIVSQNGRKFRSRGEISKYCELNNLIYKADDFDFYSRSRQHTPSRLKESEETAKPEAVPPPVKSDTKKTEETQPVKSEETVTKSSVPETISSTSNESNPVVSKPVATTNEGSSVMVGSLEIKLIDGQLICPETSCQKHFRNNNLLQMHIKHYHPEFCKFLDYTPSVTDLAYARTVGNWPESTIQGESSLNIVSNPTPTRNPERKSSTLPSSSKESPARKSDSPRNSPRGDQTTKGGNKSPSLVKDCSVQLKILDCPADGNSKTEADSKSNLNETVSSTATPEAFHSNTVKTSYHRRSNSDSLRRKVLSDREKTKPASSEATGVTNLETTNENEKTNETRKYDKLRRNEIIHCACGIMEEDGLMIQCDICLCWQHAHCIGIAPGAEVPEKYICNACTNPYKGRSGFKYLNDQQWIKTGVLPSLSTPTTIQNIKLQQQALLKKSFELSGMLNLLRKFLHTLRVKISIADQKDHPKLWLWAKKWIGNSGLDMMANTEQEIKSEETTEPKAPQPEKAIDPVECKINLLDHILDYQNIMEIRLTSIENQLAELESTQDDIADDEIAEKCPRTKATVQMLLRDLNTVTKITNLL